GEGEGGIDVQSNGSCEKERRTTSPWAILVILKSGLWQYSEKNPSRDKTLCPFGGFTLIFQRFVMCSIFGSSCRFTIGIIPRISEEPDSLKFLRPQKRS
ncbi:hypothetical protein FRX31_028669, partial [Thalictrum thalictroides]